MNEVTLRIKKKYFDQILSGKKTKEYRADTEFYKARFQTKPTVLRLHYQGNQMLVCEITGIKKIKNPLKSPERELVPTEFVYCISLKNPTLEN